MRETEEGESLRFAVSSVLAVALSEPSELEKARLVGVQREVELRKSLP